MSEILEDTVGARIAELAKELPASAKAFNRPHTIINLVWIIGACLFMLWRLLHNHAMDWLFNIVLWIYLAYGLGCMKLVEEHNRKQRMRFVELLNTEDPRAIEPLIDALRREKRIYRAHNEIIEPNSIIPKIERLLLSVTPEIALSFTEPQRRWIRSRLSTRYLSNDFVIVGVERMELDCALPEIERLAKGAERETIRAAAQHCLERLREVARDRGMSDTLLRPASAPGDETLLRPASNAPMVDDTLLLRPAASEQEDEQTTR